MTRDRLLEILCRKFPQLEFVADSSNASIPVYRIISEVNRFLSFYTYSKGPDDESAIFYLNIFHPERKIMIPNEDTELFLDYISDIILGSCKIEDLYAHINSKINRMESVEWKRDWKIGRVLD
jgi:hypothetical protein